MDDVKKRGRPRIEDVLAREANPQVETPPMKDKAYSIVKMGNNWMLVKIAFNPLSGHAGTPELTLIGSSYWEAEEKIKTILAQELFK